ncbi:rCG28540 [Rattus norvegicus]|uniref:RCG28540 n=1 Tax=Rattus norvegicus TaxID=10116 RepID=A6HV49_RAT|nr:rCG28540 [Rattus norvegicus]
MPFENSLHLGLDVILTTTTRDQMILSAPYANEVIVTSQPVSSDRGVPPEACTVAEGTRWKQRGYL